MKNPGEEEPEPPTDGTASTAAAAWQKLQVKEEPPENPAYGELFDPKIPLPVLQGQQPTKEEDAYGQHKQKVSIATNQVFHVKEEPEESINFGMHYGQKPNLSAVIQRIQIKEELVWRPTTRRARLKKEAGEMLPVHQRGDAGYEIHIQERSRSKRRAWG